MEILTAERRIVELQIITDDGGVEVNDIPKSDLRVYAKIWAKDGADLKKDGQPAIFIPAHRIKEMKYVKQEVGA